MNGFQKTVLIVAIVILMLALIVLGVLIYNSRNSDAYPPDIGNCPDYFELRQNQGKEMCFNVHGLGNGDSASCTWFEPTNNVKAEKAFAEACGLTWDGVTNL